MSVVNSLNNLAIAFTVETKIPVKLFDIAFYCQIYVDFNRNAAVTIDVSAKIPQSGIL